MPYRIVKISVHGRTNASGMGRILCLKVPSCVRTKAILYVDQVRSVICVERNFAPSTSWKWFFPLETSLKKNRIHNDIAYLASWISVPYFHLLRLTIYHYVIFQNGPKNKECAIGLFIGINHEKTDDTVSEELDHSSTSTVFRFLERVAP